MEKKINRRELIKSLGAISVGSAISGILPAKTFSADNEITDISKLPSLYKGSPICWLTPQKTEGPYYFNPNLLRSDIRISTNNNVFHDGIQLNMAITVIDIDCNPVHNVLVDVWHCNKDGIYSGYSQPGGNYVGHDFMRGIQLTDIKGVSNFITSYPGWYPGRATHIHFKVRLNSTTFVTSQYCFLDSVNNVIYSTPLYSGRGPNPTTNAGDGIFNSPDPQYLRMTAEPNANGGYDGTYTIGITAPTVILDPQYEADGYYLEQNYPNPFNPFTNIKYKIPASSNVRLTIYDIHGKELLKLIDKRQTAGEYTVIFDGTNFGSGYYFYKLEAGDYSRSREMLLLK